MAMFLNPMMVDAIWETLRADANANAETETETGGDTTTT
jgi:hypothetical protein